MLRWLSVYYSIKKRKKKKKGEILPKELAIGSTIYSWGCPHGVMVKAMVCEIVAHEFKLQSHYYDHFQTNTLGKGIDPPYPPS